MVATGTLLTSPTVSIVFDGLIIFAYNEASRVCQAGIHTQAENHELQLTVIEAGDPEEQLVPSAEFPWDGSHENVKAVSPLWLYVDSGNGRRPEEFSATLFQPDDKRLSQSFGHILDFEGAGLYNRRLTFNPVAFALLNVANGEFYSAQNVATQLKNFGQNEPFASAAFVQDIVICSKAAADIDAKSEPGGPGGEPPVVRSLVLEQENPTREVFRLKLEEGKHYIVTFVNGPRVDPAHAGHAGHATPVTHAEHFLQFYEMFSLLPDEKKFLVDLPPTGNATADAPPCNVGRAGSSGGIS